ncbi:hypothetical protein LSUE1_G009783 [Lachnellula suecica]|uniref:Uncharacterized protein n=1 Tax=Lachnellula suecica TaxID=602035 RepID=A0A8T9BRM5_9HELO|nr:hypothetical protein LSUE1_G009783 [Lachnellula suecica]
MHIYSVAIEPDGGIFIAAVGKASDDSPPLWFHCGPAHNLATAYELVYCRVFNKISEEHSSSVKSLSHLNLTFGPFGAYFCVHKDGFFSRDIPESLVFKLESVKVKPRQVALGRGQAWVALWTDGTFSYNLGTNYPDLAERLHERFTTKAEIAFIALNPYDDDSWFMVDCNGFCSWSFKNMTKDQVSEISRVTLGYLQRRSRRTGESFTNVRTVGNKSISTQVTPETSFDDPAKSFVQRALKFGDMQFNIGLQYRTRLPQELIRRPDVIAGFATGVSTTVFSRALGIKTKSALTIGIVAGTVTFAVVSKGLSR